MNKQEWQSLYEILDRIYSDFLLAYSDSEHGRNKKIRSDAERKVDNAISLADYHILKNWEIYVLLTGGENNTDYGRAIIYDEFKKLRYFRNDMPDFLNKIKGKMASFDS